MIRVLVKAEEGFDPHTDIDLKSLRFGASEAVNYGRGSKVLKTEKDGADLIVTFDGTGNGITANNFAPPPPPPRETTWKNEQGKTAFRLGSSAGDGIDRTHALGAFSQI